MRAFGRRVELMQRCVGTSRTTHTPVDLSSVLSDASSLQELVADMWLPFAQQQVDVVVAVHEQQQTARLHDMDVHHFTAAIAGAIASAQRLALSEATVLPLPQRVEPAAVAPSPVKKQQKRGRATAKRTRKAATQPAPVATLVLHPNPDFVCHRVVCVDAGALRVELKRQTIAAAQRVLLVFDWIDRVDTVLAVRDAIARLGADVVGVSVVVATDAALVQELKRAQVLVHCAWTPPLGSAVARTCDSSGTRSIVPTGKPVAANTTCACHAPALHRIASTPRKRRRSVDSPTDRDTSDEAVPLPYLTHVTAQYQGNNPSEDRSVNIAGGDRDGIRIHAVFDGHGGSLAVEHLRKTLCQQILSTLAADDNELSIEQVTERLMLAFVECDDALKRSLLALPAETHLSKGFCNSGACAAVALFVNTVLFVANVGDCAVVVGKRRAGSTACVATQLSVDHSCSSADEVKRVFERSRDRNAIRLSKDDQASGVGGFGVKRVAGSLAVTRAFGDFYLKCEELSAAPFKSKLPYITVEPSVSAHALDGSERFVILGSDGLWEVLTPDEAVHIVETFDPTQSLFFSSVSAALIHSALEKIAHRDGLMLHEVMALPPGPARRRFHDDITCTVVYIHHANDVDDAHATTEEDDSVAAEAEAEAEPENIRAATAVECASSSVNGHAESES